MFLWLQSLGIVLNNQTYKFNFLLELKPKSNHATDCLSPLLTLLYQCFYKKIPTNNFNDDSMPTWLLKAHARYQYMGYVQW
jgi:hypothetical protein